MADQIDLTDILSDYSKEVWEATEKAQKQVAQETVAELKQVSPKRSGKYARSWRAKRDGTAMVVHNLKPGLAHLIENGHALRNGGRSKAEPHIAPVAEKMSEAYVQAVKEALE